ncbi:MAG: ABC transporter ATP-binding protein [Ruminococcus sp.]|nr:ABC transporter ATP-binding protein [Ruminococcus sp.]
MNKIELNNVSVSYIVGDFSTVGLKDVVIQKIKRNYKVKEFLAVDNVNFAIDEGDLLGIVGANGAGKSTLLKVISGIMRPTNGTMSVNGNIASLLELGSGFDGDLTVKENTFLRGAMLGYTRDFMNQTYRDIIEFAELTEFEDRLFSHLSSGMRSRLAFSIACLVKPDILILDEVLSVGDGAFRKKSENKMMEIIKGGSTTILVSHSLAQIRRMATKVLWLDKGKQIAFGETKEICDRYEAFLNQK